MLRPILPEFLPGRPLPDHRPAAEAIRAALPALLPAARVTVPEAGARRMVKSGGQWIPWRNDVAPYMREPAEVITSRRFDSVVFVGPARSAKTEGLLKNAIAHMILAAPRLAHFVTMDRTAAREWSIEELGPLLRNSPELAERLASGQGADNVFEKRFLGGGRLTLGYPVASQFASRSIPLVLLTEYDKLPQDVEGEGSPFALARKRTNDAGSRAMTVVESSPRFPILDESWEPSAPHEAPPCDGILGLYNPGTRGRWYWDCPHCGETFEPDRSRLHYPSDGSPAERAAAAVMVCPSGCVIEPAQKSELNARGRWLHEAADGSLVPLAEARPASTASYWLKGAAAAFASWAKIVARELEGEEHFARTGDEGGLKAAINVEHGEPYLPRALSATSALSETALRKGATDRPWRVAPPGTRFITIAADVQDTRFPVQVEAWGEGLERTVIDRFDLVTPPPAAPHPEGRAIAPPRYAEDWDALFALAARDWPVAGAGYRLRACGIVVDAGGSAGVTPNAYAFYRRAKAAHRGLYHVVRGRGGLARKRAERAFPERAHQGGKKKAARDVPIIWAGTDRLKDEIAASLTRAAEGARALLVPRDAPPAIWAEYAAERRTDKGWEPKPGIRRNEALDLSVYSLALAIVLGAERIDWSRPPHWARGDASNSRASRDAGVDAPAPQPKPAEASRPPRQATRPTRRARRGLTGW